MGLVRFDNFGDISNAGPGDGIEGKVHDFLEALPKDTFHWLSRGEEITSFVPYAEWENRRVIIDVYANSPLDVGKPAIGVNLPKDSRLVDDIQDEKIVFEYKGVTYEVRHKLQEIPKSLREVGI